MNVQNMQIVLELLLGVCIPLIQEMYDDILLFRRPRIVAKSDYALCVTVYDYDVIFPSMSGRRAV